MREIDRYSLILEQLYVCNIRTEKSSVHWLKLISLTEKCTQNQLFAIIETFGSKCPNPDPLF